ncbi:MAG: hypothetical protein WAN72_07835 [Candidatus Acidiferrales bacterium]
MKRRYLATLCFAVLFIAGIALTPTPAAAQMTQDYYTYVSQWAVPRAQWEAFDKQEQSDVPRMKKLVADGTIVDWGNDTVRVHQEDGYTHAEWFTATSRANLLKALEEQWTTATNASYVSSTKHSDLFLHTIAHGGNAVSNGTGYLRVGFYQAKPGDGEALHSLFTKSIKPFLDSAVGNGTLTMYNIDEEDIHTSAPGGYNMALLFPDGAAMDKFFADLMAADKADSTIGQMLDSLTVGKEHRDSFGRVTAYQHK